MVMHNSNYPTVNYYFAKIVKPEYACGVLPVGKKVIEQWNGVLFLGNKWFVLMYVKLNNLMFLNYLYINYKYFEII